jgi:hypothetical protein
MRYSINQIKNQFQNSGKINCFEIEVVTKVTTKQEYIIFNVCIQKNSFVATFEPLTKKQDKSKKIAFVKQKIDSFFSLEGNLQSLYELCINQILQSDYFMLAD